MKTYATVHAVATNGKGEYLILQRADHRTNPGTWNVVTGYLHERESAEDAALRELKEETNLEGEIIKTSEPFWRDNGDTRWIMVSSLIMVKNIDELKIDPAESQNFKWIKADDSLIEESPGMKLSFKYLGLLAEKT